MRAMGKVDPTYWATMEEWKEKEAAALFKYSGLLKRMIDATNHHRIPYPWTPARWLAWAKERDIPASEELAEEIDKWSGVSGSAGSAERGGITEPETRAAELAAKADGRLSGVEGSPPALPTSNANVANRCEDWLKSEMEKSPQFRPKRKSDFREDAQGSFEGLTEREFNQAWKNAMESTGATAWSAPGRPRKSIQKS